MLLLPLWDFVACSRMKYTFTFMIWRWVVSFLLHSIIYIVSRHSSREHRALTKFRHLTRLLVSTLTSFRVLPWCLISSKIVLRHVVRGLPRDLVSWGFHSKAAFAMSPGGRRSMWPSHPHFLCRISSSIGFCLALAHSSWFDIRTGQNIFSILRSYILLLPDKELKQPTLRKLGWTVLGPWDGLDKGWQKNRGQQGIQTAFHNIE